MKSVLVTGASGFTGRYMIAALKARGFHTVGLGGAGCGADVCLSCDLTDRKQVAQMVYEARPTHVVHLAGIAFVGHGTPEDFYRVNLFGTLNLLDALVNLGTKPRVLLASSANVYGDPNIDVVDESICPKPLNHYATSKLAMEHMARTYFGLMPMILARPFNYTGVGQTEQFLIPKIVGHFKRKEPVIELGNMDVSRDFSDVRDTVDAYAALLESDVESETINVCSGRAVSLREILGKVCTLAGYEIAVTVNPAFVRKNEIPSLRGNRSKLTSLVQCAEPRPLIDTLEWMYSNSEVVGIS